MCSHLRTIWYGSFWTDTTGTLAQGMPPMAYSRYNAMSDALQATLMNPWYMVQCAVPGLDSDSFFVHAR